MSVDRTYGRANERRATRDSLSGGNAPQRAVSLKEQCRSKRRSSGGNVTQGRRRDFHHFGHTFNSIAQDALDAGFQGLRRGRAPDACPDQLNGHNSGLLVDIVQHDVTTVGLERRAHHVNGLEDFVSHVASLMSRLVVAVQLRTAGTDSRRRLPLSPSRAQTTTPEPEKPSRRDLSYYDPAVGRSKGRGHMRGFLGSRLAIGVALGVVIALGACGSDQDPTFDAEPTTNPTGTPASTTLAPNVKLFAVSVREGKVDGGARTAEVNVGDQVRIEVTSDAADEVHVHGYDLTGALEAGVTTRIDLIADKAGQWEIELHDAGIVVTTLRVNP